jgi:hypothetical protein
MKNQIIISTYILFFSSLICFGQQTKFKLEDEGKLDVVLNGKVKTIKITTENLKNKSLDSLVYCFNPKGLPDKIISYGLGLNVLFKKFVNEEVHYDFSENNLLSKLNKLSFGLDGDKYEYDENWNLISVKNYMSNILVKEILSKYDNKNRIVEKTEYLYGGFSDYNPTTQEGKSKYLEEGEKYEYNSQDKVIQKLTYNFRENKTVKITQYKYDENGNVIEEGNCLSYGEPNCEIKPLFGFEYNSKNLVTRKFQLAKFSPHNTDYYDEKGNEIEVKGFYIYPEKEPILGYDYKYEFDEFGNQTKEEESIGNYRMIGFTKYKTQLTQYDKFHSVISDEYITSDGLTIKLIKKSYIYDKKGNWLKMETSEGKNSEDLKLIEISKREIKYY